MSEFGKKIRELIPPGGTIRDLATQADVDPTNLSRIISADRRKVNPETLSRICLRITPNRQQQAELLAAFLRDLRIPSLANLVEVRVLKKDEKPTRKEHDPDNPAHVLASMAETLDPASAEALCRIAKNLGNRSLRRVILGLGEVAAGE